MSKKKANTTILNQWLQRPLWSYSVVFLIGFALYVNTLGHGFTQDDAIVIYDNDLTKEGFSGIDGIFSQDSFAGFFKEDGKSSLVAGGRYRPLSLAAFAVLWEFFGESTMAFHLFVVLCYALLGCLVLMVFKNFDYPKELDQRILIGLILAIVFITHPIHTEAVANIKGLDETFSLGWSLLAMFFAIRFVRSGAIVSMLLVAVTYFFAMISKENAAAFVVLIPLTLWGFLKQPSIKRIAASGAVLMGVFVLYVIIRGQVIGWEFGDPPNEMMNNPFIKLEGNRYLPFTVGERWASVIYGLGKYVQLLFFPHPLTHDYYPRVFGVVDFADPAVLMSIIMHASLIVIAIIGIRKKSIISYCILWFYATIALMSNVVFPIGTHLSERFLFTPSLAYAGLIAFAFYKAEHTKFAKFRIPILVIIIILFSIKTITRNQAWQSDFKLFTTDVHVSKNSAKVRNAAGGALVDAAGRETDLEKQKVLVDEAIIHLDRATELHPNYKNAYLLKGNGYLYVKEYDKSIAAYDTAIRLDPYYDEASGNLLIALRAGARYTGETLKDFDKSINYLTRALALSPQDYGFNSMMGVAQGSAGKHNVAISYFEKAIAINPEIARAYVNLGYAQLNVGLEDDAQINFQKAVQLDPKAMDR